MTTPNADEDVEHELSFITGGNEKWYSHFGRQFNGFTQNKTHSNTTWFSNDAPCYLPIWAEKLCPHKNLHHSFIHTYQNIKANKIPFSRWVNNKLWDIQTIECYSALKRNELSNHEKTWGNLKGTVKMKKANVKKLHTVWLQIYGSMIFWKKQNYGTVKRSVAARDGRGMSRKNTEDF